VHLGLRRQLAVDLLKKFQELLRMMAALTFSDHPAGGHLQGREQGVVP